MRDEMIQRLPQFAKAAKSGLFVVHQRAVPPRFDIGAKRPGLRLVTPAMAAIDIECRRKRPLMERILLAIAVLLCREPERSRHWRTRETDFLVRRSWPA